MKQVTISLLTIMTLSSTTALSALTLYGDPKTGRIYYQPGDGRVKMGNFVEEETIYKEKEAQDAKIKELPFVKPKETKGNKITIIDQKSPEFLLGKQTHINMKFVPEDNPDMWLKAGVRIQGTFENINTDYKNSSIKDTNIDDAYLRRVRFEVAAGFGPMTSFVMDIRNDKSNYGIENKEGDFNVGDAYVKIKKPFGTSLVNFKLYRAKIDVSRTETVKSARVIAYDRPYIADAAAQFISFNRRGTNVQMYGDWNKKVHYQIAAGDATAESKLKDAVGATGANVTDQSFFYGGKLILSPFDGWEETKRTETYFAEGKHAEIGLGYWNVPQTKGTTSSDAFDLNHELINVEASAHYKGFFIQGEYFKFKDVVDNWTATTLEKGDSDGWYITSEYVFKDLYYLAPFIRYEVWDTFKGKADKDITSTLVGLNWYLRGNTTKVGIVYQEDEFDKDTTKEGEKDVRKIRVTSQWFF